MRHYIVSLFAILITNFGVAQVATIIPANASPEQSVTVTFDASSTPLAGEPKIYMHSGVVVTNTASPSGSDWKFVKGDWGQDNGIGQMTAISGQPNKWQLVLTPTLRAFYNVPNGTNIFWLSMVFRNADGTKQTSPDIYIKLFVPDFVSITSPTSQNVFVESGQLIELSGTASSLASAIEILVDEGSGFVSLKSSTNVSSITTNYLPNSGTITVKITAVINSAAVQTLATFSFTVRPTDLVLALPPGIKDGINYDADPTKVTLVLLAPEKDFVYATGDFSNWELRNEYFMNKTPDGKRFWKEITGLTPGQEYVFQYWVDGIIKIGDPLADKVADPYNDSFIPASTYPDLPVYTKTDFGIATVFQTNQPLYTWAQSELTWNRPDKKNLLVYELLIRDFLGSRDYKDLMDTIPYLKRLGINAIELMPVMEFEGNLSWGYNPSYFLAPDKFYGSKQDLKRFIEKAHQNGIAVIMDMVLNHAFGQNAMVQMYFDKNAGKPALDNPWFNRDATHPFNVGYDFNHESPYTKAFVDTVCNYWLSEYHVDGFRFDLSKGFTQKNNPGNVGAWSAFDQSRIDILSRMATELWKVTPEAYVILEHFADNQEETVLANLGMLLWGNQTGTYASALNGDGQTDLSGANRKSHVNYMESHDEERQLFKLLTNGNSQGSYNIRDLGTALNRAKLGAAFFFTVPGPKMLWQFEELGYDKSINFCPNGTINNNCRVDNKPLPWGTSGLGYYTNDDRQRLYGTLASINRLVNSNTAVFKTGTFVWSTTGDIRTIKITHPTMDVAIVGNFSLTYKEASAIFTKTGNWFDFFGNTSFSINDVNEPIVLAPGEFHIYTTVVQPPVKPGLVDFLITSTQDETEAFYLYPNPTKQKRVNIELGGQYSGLAQVKIYNATGAVVGDIQKNVFAKQPFEVDMSNASSGLYFFKIEIANRIFTSKLVVE